MHKYHGFHKLLKLNLKKIFFINIKFVILFSRKNLKNKKKVVIYGTQLKKDSTYVSLRVKM